MGCNSSYMDPTAEESNSKKMAILVCHVYDILNMDIPEPIRHASNHVYGNTLLIDQLVVMLCEVCTRMTDDQKDSIIYNGRDATSRDLASWWDRHKAADEARILLEKEAIETQRLRDSAISKLTAEEIKALGF